jgi:Trypsin-like peptidase domain
MREGLLRRRLRAVLVGIFVTAPWCGAAAQDRGDQIRQAEQYYQNFQTEPALINLRAALDPTRGQPDSIWAHGVHLMAQIYFEQGDTVQATTWLRWAFRTDPTISVDPAKFLPEVLALSEASRAWVRRTESEGDFATETRFEWPVGRIVPETGSLRIDNAGLGVPLRVLVQRSGDPQGRPVSEGVTANLGPGSYEVQAAADGYLGVRITRVVLPGVTTVLKFNLQTIGAAAAGPPTMVDPMFGQMRAQTARLSLWRFGSGPTCASGFYVGSTFLVTTYDAIEGADSIMAQRSDGMRIENRVIRVVAYDTTANVAVLKLPTHRDSLTLGRGFPRRGQWVFPLAFTDCNAGTLNNRAVRVALGDDPIELAESTAGAQLGAAVVDSTGAVLGLTFRGDRAIPVGVIAGLVDDARQRDRAGQLMTLAMVAQQEGHTPQTARTVAGQPQQQRRGGGFPILIVVGGLAAAGGAAALLLASKGGGGGGGNGTTGSIFIRFPNQ